MTNKKIAEFQPFIFRASKKKYFYDLAEIEKLVFYLQTAKELFRMCLKTSYRFLEERTVQLTWNDK